MLGGGGGESISLAVHSVMYTNQIREFSKTLVRGKINGKVNTLSV